MRVLSILALTLMTAMPLSAQAEDPTQRLVIKGYGDITLVPDDRLTPDTKFRVAYDISAAGESDAPNRRLITPARFLNMHAAAGVPAENMELAVVVHGGAYKDLLTDEARGEANPNADLIAQLVAAGTRIELCGQTAAYYKVSDGDLLPGVKIVLSAMTSHALLQQDGFTLNPF